MGNGYVLTRSPVEVEDARAVVTFSAGPWAQMVAFHEGSLKTSRDSARRVLGDSAREAFDMLYGIPPLPIPHAPKIIYPPPGWLVAIVLARVAPGVHRAYLESLDSSVVTGAVQLLAPYSHVLLDITAESEDRLLDALNETLDRPEVLKTRVGIALADDVVYLDAPG